MAKSQQHLTLARASAVTGFVAVPSLSVLLATAHHALFSLALALLAMIPFYVKYEGQEPSAEETVLMAMLAAIAAVSRVPFASLPGAQPTSFVIIMAAVTFGPEVGFMVGSTAAVVSNMFLGQGPWTPWQMFSWGMIGFTAGYLKETKLMATKWGQAVFGFCWGFLFGWIMNIWFVLYLEPQALTGKVFVASCIASFRHDLNHALSNAVFIILLQPSWNKILKRTQIKFGLFG